MSCRLCKVAKRFEDTWLAFVKVGGRFYVGEEPITLEEFQDLTDDALKNATARGLRAFSATAQQQNLVLIVPRAAAPGFPRCLDGSEVYFLPANEAVRVVAEIGVGECIAFAPPIWMVESKVDRASASTDAAANPGRRLAQLLVRLRCPHALNASFEWALGEICPGATIEIQVDEIGTAA